MPIRKAVNEIVDELQQTLSRVSPEGLERLVEAVLDAERLYVAGGGRSGRVTYVVGETTTPAIRSGDLLVSCSASGQTQVTVLVSKVAQKAGARVFAITATPSSPMARLADETIVIAAPSKRAGPAEGRSIQYGGSLFEQALLILLDAVSAEIGRRLGTGPKELDSRHANLE